MSVYSNSIYELTGLTNNVCFFDGIELTEFDNTIHDTGYTYSGLTLIIDYTNFTSHFDTTGHTYSNVILSNDVYTYTGFTGETHYFVIYDIYSGYTPYIDPLFDGLTENEVIDGFTTDIISCTDILNGLTGTCCPTQQVLSNFPVVMITNEGSGTDNCDDYIARRQELGWTLDFVFNKNGNTGWTESVFWFTGARDEYEVENYADNGLSFRFTDDGKIMWTAYRFSGYCDTISGYTEMFYIDSGTTENALCTGGTINDFNITITFERFNKYDGECDLSNEGGWNDLIIWTGTTEELNKKWTNERNKRLGTLKIYHNGKPIYKYKGFEETVLSDRGYQPFTHVIGGGVTGSDGIHEGTFCYTIKYAGYFEDPATFIEIQNNYDTIITEDYNISECSDDCVDNVVMVTPSRTPTVTRTPSRTPTPTRTPSLTPTVTMTPSITPTPARIPTILGLLYHGCVIKNPLNLSNADWHIATKSDFDTLALNVNNLGGELKETGYTYWQEPNAGATNSTLFTAKGAGRRFIDGSFSYINQRAIFWTSTTGLTEDRFYIIELRYDYGLIFTYDVALGFGFSVRLIKDSTTLIPGQIGTYTGNDGKVYRTICVGGDYGNQEWLISNLAETQYRDGTLIPEIRDSASWSDASACGYCAYDNNWLYVPDIAPTPSISATTSITPSITSSNPYWSTRYPDNLYGSVLTGVTGTTIYLTWTNNGTQDYDNIIIERSADSGSTYSEINSILSGEIEYIDETILDIQTYYYRVRYKLNTAYSIYSNIYIITEDELLSSYWINLIFTQDEQFYLMTEDREYFIQQEDESTE